MIVGPLGTPRQDHQHNPNRGAQEHEQQNSHTVEPEVGGPTPPLRNWILSRLRLRGLDVLTAQEDGAATMDDPVLLDRAIALGRVVFTQDEDFLREADRERRRTGLRTCNSLDEKHLIQAVAERADFRQRAQLLFR